jgi:HlyD family secretion protein
MSRLSRMVKLIAVSLVVACVALILWDSQSRQRWGRVWQSPGVNRANSAAPETRPETITQVHALARLEPEGGLVVVGARPGARIERFLVVAGDSVSEGQALVILEGQNEARRQLALAEARKADAIDQRARKRDQVAVERTREDRLRKVRETVLDDTIKALKAEDDRLSKSLSDLGDTAQAGRLRDDLVLKLDQVRIESYKAYFEREQARIDYDLLDRQRALQDKGLDDGGPDDQVLDRQVELARAALDATAVKAPASGVVIDVLAHAGEVGSGPLLALGPLDEMTATAEVDQQDADRLKPGDPAEVTILGTAVPGKVTTVGRLVGRNQLINVDPRALTDRRVLKVTIRLASAELAARFVNMQVDAAISPSGGSVP